MKTVRDIVAVLACDGATVVSILGALPTYILDAIVIGCEVCGGKGFLAKPSGDFPDPGSTFISCPSCHGKSFVVSKEARRAFAVAMVAAASGLDEVGEEWEEMCGYWGESYEEAVARFERCMGPVARALLGGEVYEATAVLEGEVTWSTVPYGKKKPVFYVDIQHEGFLTPTPVAAVGDVARIAILGKEMSDG